MRMLLIMKNPLKQIQARLLDSQSCWEIGAKQERDHVAPVFALKAEKWQAPPKALHFTIFVS